MTRRSPIWDGVEYGAIALVSVVVLGLLLAVGAGCTMKSRDRTVYYSETGIAAADLAWDTAYRAKLAACESKFEPQTPGAEACFGGWYDADGKVEKAVEKAAGVLRLYWSQRAAGETPSWAKVAAELVRIMGGLPPEAEKYFQRVRGLD
jgi:hypothetical protein